MKIPNPLAILGRFLIAVGAIILWLAAVCAGLVVYGVLGLAAGGAEFWRDLRRKNR